MHIFVPCNEHFCSAERTSEIFTARAYKCVAHSISHTHCCVTMFGMLWLLDACIYFFGLSSSYTAVVLCGVELNVVAIQAASAYTMCITHANTLEY